MKLQGISDLVVQGRQLFSISEELSAHEEFNKWVEKVSDWLLDDIQKPELSAEWHSLGTAEFVKGNSVYSDSDLWITFHNVIQERFVWLARLNSAILPSENRDIIQHINLDGFVELVTEGRALFSIDNEFGVHERFYEWAKGVSDWLDEKVYDSGLSAEWYSLKIPELIQGNTIPSDPDLWSAFHQAIQERFDWLRKVISITTPSKENEVIEDIYQKTFYVEPSRIEELKRISNKKFDLQRLITMCEELNFCYHHQCYLAIMMLTRAILDHVPPIFGVKRFSEIANNYAGSKSFKESMNHLAKSSRKIADSHLHTHIKSKEVLPNFTQVNFSNDLDVLLQEIARILK